MIYLQTICCLLVLLFFHEISHYLSARILHLNIEKIGFKFFPYPSFYVTIINTKITKIKKLIFMLSGNLMTISLFTVTLCLDIKNTVLLAAFAIQLSSEFNPFRSDYQQLIFQHLYKNKILSCYSEKNPEIAIKKLFSEEYLCSPIWVIHFVIWATITIILFKNFR